MFINIPTHAHRSSVKLILKLLRHVSVFLKYPRGVYRFSQLKLWITGLIKYNRAVCSYGISNRWYVEIKCQLDATEVFIADLIACSTCFGHHYAHHQEFKSIIQWLLPVVFGVVVFKLLVWCGAEGYVSGLQDAGTMPIIRSSRVLYSGCCLWYLVLWFSSCWSGVELRVMCPVCRMLQHPENRT